MLINLLGMYLELLSRIIGQFCPPSWTKNQQLNAVWIAAMIIPIVCVVGIICLVL